MEKCIGVENVITSSPVTTIDQTNKDFVLVELKDGRKYKSNHVILATPPHFTNQIVFLPPLPAEKYQLNAKLPMGHLIKFIATFESCFWKDENNSGESIVVADKFSSETFCCTFDGTSPGGNPAIVGFIGGENASHWSEKTQTERQNAVIERLVAMFGSEARSSLIHYYDIDWSKEHFVGGCPVGVGQTGALYQYHEGIRTPFDRVHWAGTETSQVWTGYMEGAVQSGQRAAREVVRLNSYSIPEETSEVDEDTKSSNISLILVGSAAVAFCAFYAYKSSKNFFKVK